MACSAEDLAKISEVASDEIGETGVDIGIAVKKVREILAEKYGNLIVPPKFDHLLERSLRYKKFDVDEVATHLHLYFKFLQDLYVMHGDMYFLPSLLKSYFFDSFGLIPLKKRDAQGRVVILANSERLPVKGFDLDKAVAATVLLIDELTRISVDTQRIGLVVVLNFKEYGFGHAKQFTLARVRAIVRLLQGSCPMRLKAIYAVRAPALFTYLYAAFRPFLGEKLKKRIHVYGNELSEFHEHVSPEILPDFLGGKLFYEESVDTDFVKRLIANEEYYKDLFKVGYFK